MVYPRFAPGQRHGHNVEPDVVLPVFGEDVMLGSLHHQLGFCIVHKLFGVAKTDVGAGLDLHKYQRLAMLGYKVNLGVLVAVVSLQNLVAFALQVGRGLVFAHFAGVVVLCHIERFQGFRVLTGQYSVKE